MAKMLIVEDDAESRYLLSSLLVGHGHEVREAANGADALRFASKDPPDLVVSDILMPEMDGFTLCREWMKDERLRRIPLVLYTATYTDERDEELAMAEGARRFLIKPMEPEALLQNLEEVIAEARQKSDYGLVDKSYKREAEQLRLYSDRLVKKIERKMLQLEQANLERERLEQQLRGAQRLEAIGGLAGGIAHDFNNLLSVIMCCSSVALERLGDLTVQRENLLEIQKAGQRAADLTQQLLAFSRKQVLQPVSLDINQVIAGLEKMLRRILGEDIEFSLVIEEGRAEVKADPSQLEQVLTNLVVNARDAMPKGGKLTVETRKVELCEAYAARHVAVKPGAYVMLAVSDTGAGMDEKTRGRIFEPFFTTKERGKGTGLGLSMVYGIVKQSGGNIWVYSEPGRGTTFKVYLPRAEAPAVVRPHSEGHRAPQATSVFGTETIVVVEDEDVVRRLVGQILEDAGYEVLAAASGARALELCAARRGEIHLVLTDVIMPRMSGKALVDELAREHPKIKALYMSGYTDNAIVHHGILDPGTRFIGKPFSAEALCRKVREVLDEEL